MENVLERMKRENSDKKIADFMVKEKQPYSFKRKYAAIRAREFAAECEKRGLNYHVSVGGLDSIVLFLFLRSIGIYAPAISVSYLEDRSIQQVHTALGIEKLQSAVREVRPDDPCYLTEKAVPWNGMLEDVLRQEGIPFVTSGRLGAGLSTYVGPVLEITRFYVPWVELSRAQDIVDGLFNNINESED